MNQIKKYVSLLLILALFLTAFTACGKEETAAATQAAQASAEDSGDAAYTVTYVDQNGDPVPGVMCQVCDETMCQVFTSDADGVCRFTLPAGNYEIHTMMVPAGYEGDTTTVTNAPAQGGDLTFTMTKK